MKIQLNFIGVLVLLNIVSATNDANAAQIQSRRTIQGSNIPVLKEQNTKVKNLAKGNPSDQTSEDKTSASTNATTASTSSTASSTDTTTASTSSTASSTDSTTASTSKTEAPKDNEAPDFTKFYYITSVPKKMMKATYQIPWNVAFKHTFAEPLKFTLEDALKLKMAPHFKIERTNEKFTISVKENIPEKMLQEASQFLFVLSVTKKNSTDVLCHTTLLINLIDEFELTFSNVTVGYPKSYDYIEKYAPPVVASFAPNGDTSGQKNFNIRYLIREETCPFMIHEKTGSVYPVTYYGGNEDVHCTVLAQSRHDDEVKSEQNLTLTVKFLKPSQMVELYLRNVTLDTLDATLNKLKSDMKITLKALSYTVLPSNPKEKLKVDLPLMKIHGYAFENQTNDVVDGEVIVERLNSILNLVDARVLSEEDSPEEPVQPSYNYSLLIAIVLLFSVMLILASGVFYMLFMRNGCILCGIRCIHGDGNATTPLEEDMEGPSQTRWINSSQTDIFNRCNQRNSIENGFTTSDYHNADTIILDWKNYPNRSLQTFGLTTFKPSSDTNEYVSMDNADGNSAEHSSSNNVPILPVVSLPPIANDRMRNRKAEIIHRTTEIRI